MEMVQPHLAEAARHRQIRSEPPCGLILAQPPDSSRLADTDSKPQTGGHADFSEPRSNRYRIDERITDARGWRRIIIRSLEE